jgi:hypothetical protein
MTLPSDELRQLWNSYSGGKCDTAELLRRFEQSTRSFDRTVGYRDLRETVAGVLVTVIFLWFAIYDRTPLERAAHVWLAACGVWVAFYLWRYAKASRKPALEQTLLAYRQGLLERYERQILLLKSAKYWYVLPFWAGLLFSAVAGRVRTGNALGFWLMVAFVTMVNAVLWWLNDVVGVRHLQNERRKLVALTGSDLTPTE